MVTFIGFAYSTGGMVTLTDLNLEALLMYGLVAFVIGLIAWSKYKEPPLSDPYPTARSGQDLPETGRADAVPPKAGVPIARTRVAAGEQP